MSKTTKRGKTSNLIRQSEIIEAEVKEVDLQLEQLREKKEALTQALQLARNDERRRTVVSTTPASLRPSEVVARQEVEEEMAEEEQEGDQEEEQRALSSLSWRPFRSGKKGEWTFATDRMGNLMSPLQSSHSLVSALRGQRRVSLGGYHYKMSQDGKFLHRFPAESDSL